MRMNQVRNYYQPDYFFEDTHPITVERTPKWVRVYFGGECIADSRDVLLLHEEGHTPIYYFPKDDVRMDLLEPTNHTTHCPYKGIARYYSVETGNQLLEDIAWYYPFPTSEAAGIENCLCFYHENDNVKLLEDN